MGAGIGTHQRVQQGCGVGVEHHPVDGLEFQAAVVEIHQLAQGVPGGQGIPFFQRHEPLLPLVALLGSGQGVITVAHGEEHDGLILRAVFGVEGGGLRQGGQRPGHLRQLLLGEEPALDMPALLHQVKVVQQLHGAGLCGQRLDDGTPGVVGKQHGVGQLDGGVLAHRNPGRDAGHDHALRGPDERVRPRLVVVGGQIRHAHQSPANAAVVQGALHVNHGSRQGFKPPLPDIPGHGGVDVHDVDLHLGAVQAALGQDQPQGGGGAAHPLLHPLPVLGLGGVLVAGHDRPFVVVAVRGQEDVCGQEGEIVKGVCHGGKLLSAFQNYLSFRNASQPQMARPAHIAMAERIKGTKVPWKINALNSPPTPFSVTGFNSACIRQNAKNTKPMTVRRMPKTIRFMTSPP